MKKHLLPILLALLLSVQAAPAQWRYSNPVLHTDYSDPDVCRAGEDYYMTASSFNFFPGLPILHSRDLVHWDLVGAALTDYPFPDDAVQHGNGVWAPAIRYHDGRFYIFCGDPDRGIFMVSTDDPRGRWDDPVWVVRAKGFIDPCPFWDEDGNAYLSHASAGSRAGMKSVVYLAPMAPDGTRLTGPSRIVYDGHRTQPTIEGTKMYKRDGKYYIFAPAGGVSTGWQTVLRSDSPYGPYEERIVLASAEGTVNGPHQGAWVTTPSGTDWFLHFQDKDAYGRIVHLQPMAWREDGWPVIGEDPDGDGTGIPVSSWSADGLPYAGTLVPDRAVHGDGYRPYGLPLEWQYAAVPKAWWHYALPEGGFRLFSVQQREEYRNLWDCPNLLTQKFPAERFVVTAKLTLRPNPELKEKGEEGGFLVLGDDYAGLRIKDAPEGVRLEFFVCRNAALGTGEEVTPLPPAETVWVKLDVRAEGSEPVPAAVCRFSYSSDGKNYVRAGQNFTARPGRWVGARFGFYCNRSVPKNDSGFLEVSGLSVQPQFAPLSGFVYDESGVPSYTLPDVLTLENGKKVTTIRQWERKRRPELLGLFEKEMYGTSQVKEEPFQCQVVSEGPALDGAAVRKELDVSFGEKPLRLLLYVPARRSGPVPAFLGINFDGNEAVEPGGMNASRWPLGYIVEHGFAVATFWCGDAAPDRDEGTNTCTLATWAAALSRALDALEADPDVAGDRVAVTGFSRMGKAALWAGACDTRFAMVVSDASGCGGAALSRRHYGETVRRITTHFPYWYAPGFARYGDNEAMLPFDQHGLLSLIAPRPLYVESGSEDRWSDPYGEYLSLVEAGKVYRLYGYEAFTDPDLPPVETPQVKGVNGHHIRAGRHDITLYDWRQYVAFAEKFL